MPTRRAFGVTVLAAALSVATACGAGGGASAPGSAITLSINPAQLQYLPVMVAADRGYFRDAGVDVQIVTFQGSANNQIPLLARGDVDLSPVVSGPSLFNQFTQGFRIKLLANLTSPHAGYRDGAVIVVRKDLWDSGAIKGPKDLVGKKIDASAEGNPPDFLMRQALLSAGVDPDQAGLTHKARTPSDSVEFLRQHVEEVTVMSEPSASQAQAQGVGVRWLGYQDVIPWYQETFLAASEQFASSRSADAQKVLTAYLRAAKEIDVSGGKWTPELLATAAKWTKQKEATLKAMGGLMYFSPDGTIDQGALDRVQQFWVREKQVASPIPATDLLSGPVRQVKAGGS